MSKIELVFQPDGKRVKISPGNSILDAALLAGIQIRSLCGGSGICGKCKVMVKNGAFSYFTEKEMKILSHKELEEGYRLACSTIVSEKAQVIIPDESLVGRQRLQIEGVETLVSLEPVVKKFVVEVQQPALEDQRSDVDRLLDTLADQHSLSGLVITHRVLKKLPLALRKGEGVITATLWEKELIDVMPGIAERTYGFAVDIGTTKMAGYLLDLNTGQVVGVSSLMNPQIPYGEDVISRINYTMQSVKALKELQKAVINGINNILKEVYKIAGVRQQEVYEMTAVGNTAMHHLFLGIPPKYLGLAPYTPAIRTAINIKASDLGVKISPNANIYILPIIAGFVGADNVAVILATEVYKSDELCLALDIGTNTEIILGNKEGITVCSCASGPAFEGAHIKHGMRAASGAIENIRIDPESFDVKYQTIDNTVPKGICGSAIVDCLAELLKAGVINTNGKIDTNIESNRVRKDGDGVSEFVVVWKNGTTITEDIVITQKDIEEILLAKAAVYTGISILMKQMRITREDIEKVFIAGAFGSYIDPESAKLIGMYPDVPLEIVKTVGNAAGSGARMALVSSKARQQANELSKKVRYIELAAEPEFQEEYAASLYLPHKDLNRFPSVRATVERSRKPNHIDPAL